MALVRNIKVELLVGATNRADVAGVLRPIEGSDEGVVLREVLVERIGTFITDRVDVEVVIVGGEGQEVLVR